MNIISIPMPCGLRLVIARHAAQPRMLELAARLAALGSLRVLDGGNQFNPLPVARTLRSLTLQLEPALAGIRISRAFTCYQALALLEQETLPNRPVLVLDLLSTFYDESVPLSEARRLLGVIRSGDEHRTAGMVARLESRFAASGLETPTVNQTGAPTGTEASRSPFTCSAREGRISRGASSSRILAFSSPCGVDAVCLPLSLRRRK